MVIVQCIFSFFCISRRIPCMAYWLTVGRELFCKHVANNSICGSCGNLDFLGYLKGWRASCRIKNMFHFGIVVSTRRKKGQTFPVATTEATNKEQLLLKQNQIFRAWKLPGKLLVSERIRQGAACTSGSILQVRLGSLQRKVRQDSSSGHRSFLPQVSHERLFRTYRGFYCPVIVGLWHTIIRITVEQPGFPMKSKGPRDFFNISNNKNPQPIGDFNGRIVKLPT